MNTFEMHEQKIWALDFAESFDEEQERHRLKLITGAGDSKVKVWCDSTVEEQQKEKQAKLERIEEEVTLSNLLRENNLVQASLLAFKLNKLRDFFYAMERLVSGRAVRSKPFVPYAPEPTDLDPTLDPVLSILQSQAEFHSI